MWGVKIPTGSSDLRCAPSEDDGVSLDFRLPLRLHGPLTAEVGEENTTPLVESEGKGVSKANFRERGLPPEIPPSIP